MTPGNKPLIGDRGVVFNNQIAIFGQDFTGSTYRMQVREVPDEGGSPLVSLTTTTSSSAAGVRLVYGGADTLANHVAAGRITQAEADSAVAAGVSDSASVALSVLNIRILAATMSSLPYPDEINEGDRGDNVVLAYDLLATLPGGDEMKYLYGTFTVRGTVTQ